MLWSCSIFHAMQFMLVLSCSISLLLTACYSTNETDRLALLALKEQISYDPLGALSSWNQSFHHCQWNGVTCSRRHIGRVTILALLSQKLEGTLSPHVGNLTFLRGVDLTGNKFHGNIPKEIGHLFRLKFLKLPNNSFDGDIPSNLSRCLRFSILDLRGNKLSGGIPPELTTLAKLTRLGLGYNELNGNIPSSIGNLSFLTHLDLSDSRLVGSIPDDICRIQGLKYFNVQYNHLTGLFPSCFYNLSQMEVFSVVQNQLEGSFPPDMGVTLPNLQRIYVAINKFRGPIPFSLSNASKLSIMELGGNQFTGQVPLVLGRLQGLYLLSLSLNHLGSSLGNDLDFITPLTNCSSLSYFFVSDNSLKGSLPNSIVNLSTQITKLDLGYNQIHGTIPTGIENLFQLTGLDISHNHLTGKIPDSIGMFSQMHLLFLRGNHLTGQIPNSFGNLTLLEKLDLSSNKLDGRIPKSLGVYRDLLWLDLSSNNLNGTIPQEVIGLSSLKIILNLSNNVLSGFLPSEIGNLSRLEILDVSRNRLIGPLPNTLGNCLTLESLSMANNFFNGNIPMAISTLKSLMELDLSQNKLVGEIPKYLENFTFLTYLNLSYNELEGSVPMDGIFANASAIALVGNSKLCGGITKLQLFPCHVNKRRKSSFLRLGILLLCGSFCLVLFTCLLWAYCRRKTAKAKPSSPSLSSYQLLRISYAELLKATNSFHIDNLIGVGSYGSVYKGVLSPSNTVIAVKVLNLQQRGASKSFLSECDALRNIRHRNVLKIITSCSGVDFQGNDFKALVFEFMPNQSLEEWLHPKTIGVQHLIGNLNFLQRLNIAIDIASGLDYLHNHCQPPIVHCDLKPSNVLLDDDMMAHVADFGLAKMLSHAPYNSSESQGTLSAVKGSIGYVAPEYGIGGAVSVKGDVYSYGILLLEMLTGKRPTDEMFQDEQNLHNYAKMGLSEQVMHIMDPTMVSHGEVINVANQSDTKLRMRESLVSVVKLGVTCSSESSIERMNMGEVVTKLYHIRDHYLGARIHLE